MKKIGTFIKGLIGFSIVLPFLIILSIRYFSVKKAVSKIGGFALKVEAYGKLKQMK